MNKKHWMCLDGMLTQHGFSLENINYGLSEKWYVFPAANESGVKTVLRLSYKNKLQVLTVQVGWRHNATHNFCLEALKSDWPEGYKWLVDVGVIFAPCLNLFNISGHMGWILGGIPISQDISQYKKEEIRFSDALKKEQLQSISVELLLNRYIDDVAPFGWRACNSAIRLAEIVGLSKHLKSRINFDFCAIQNRALIESDMFGLGSPDRWISSLKSKLEQSECAERKG